MDFFNKIILISLWTAVILDQLYLNSQCMGSNYPGFMVLESEPLHLYCRYMPFLLTILLSNRIGLDKVILWRIFNTSKDVNV